MWLMKLIFGSYTQSEFFFLEKEKKEIPFLFFICIFWISNKFHYDSTIKGATLVHRINSCALGEGGGQEGGYFWEGPAYVMTIQKYVRQ